MDRVWKIVEMSGKWERLIRSECEEWGVLWDESAAWSGLWSLLSISVSSVSQSVAGREPSLNNINNNNISDQLQESVCTYVRW